MNDDMRLRDGLGPRASPPGSAAAGGGAQAELASGSGVYAALDLGTNNCRLLIACPTGDGFRVVDSFSRIIRLGEGISATGSISEAAIERAITALSICRDKIHSKKARRLRLIATEACRAASNAEGFRDRVAAATGIQLEVIDRETEAALAVIGCSPLLDQKRGGALLFGIGGGRTRVGVGRGGGGSARAEPNAAHQGMDVDPARRRHAGRAFRRQGRHEGILCA